MTNTNTNTNVDMVMLTGEGEGGGAAIETHSGEEGWPRRRLQLEHCVGVGDVDVGALFLSCFVLCFF